MKKSISVLLFTFLALGTYAQNKEADAIKAVLKEYNNAIEKLNVIPQSKSPLLYFIKSPKAFKSCKSRLEICPVDPTKQKSLQRKLKAFLFGRALIL